MDQSGESDAELLAQVATGSRQALGAVFDRHGPAVARYAWALAESRLDAEEIVQDTFVTAWQKAGAIVLAETSLLPWLLVTCRNHALNTVRKRRRHAVDVLPDEGDPALAVATTSARADAAAATDARETLRWVMAEIEQLDPLDRRICRLCLIEGRTYVEAASIVGLSTDAVKKRVSRARIRLRKGVAEDAN